MASQYSTILTSDSSTNVNQYDVIKYSDYENLKSNYETALSSYNTLRNQTYLFFNSGINLKVEGGGIIFFDWKYGFTGAAKTGSKGCSVAADTTFDLGDYYIDNNVVKCSRVGSKHRFYVVAESDLTDSGIAWDATNPSTSRATSTGFGTGKANTTLLCNAITNDMWPTVKTARATNPSGHDLVSDDSALDTRWFVPSKDELYVLNAMQHSDSNYRPSGIPQLSINYSAGTFSQLYWSSSGGSRASSATEGTFYQAWMGSFALIYMGEYPPTQTLYMRTRLCRTF